MRWATMTALAAEYETGTPREQRTIAWRCWESDGAAGIETLAYLTRRDPHQVACAAGLGVAYCRAVARRERPRRPRTPPGFRREARQLARRAGRGRGWVP